VEEATKKALTRLNAGLEEIEITVLSEGKSGILGLGSEDARIRVKRLKPDKDESTEEISAAKNILENLLAKMAVQAEIKVGTSIAATPDEEEDQPVVFNIVGSDLGILIGRRGQTIDALQYLVRLITSRQTGSKTPIIVDVENYKQQRYQDLRVLALNVAAQVKARRASFRLEPMPAFERRIIHLTLANDPDVSTESIGEGEARKVVVIPKLKK
jgi:spoIIIJ-associated protein